MHRKPRPRSDTHGESAEDILNLAVWSLKLQRTTIPPQKRYCVNKKCYQQNNPSTVTKHVNNLEVANKYTIPSASSDSERYLNQPEIKCFLETSSHDGQKLLMILSHGIEHEHIP